MKKKIKILLIICICTFSFTSCSEFHENKVSDKGIGEDVKKKSEKTVTRPTTEDQTKLLENRAAEVLKKDYSQIPNKKYAWFFCRNKEHQPSGSGAMDGVDLKKYDAYYINENAKDKVIYLTYDCGYENGYTASILDTLKREKVKAMFFVTKPFIKDEPELVKRMKKEGHFVGNHTVTHPSLGECEVQKIVEEILGCAQAMKEITGYDMDPYIRPPKGEYSERSLEVTKDLGYKTIFWSLAYLDFDINNQPGREYVVEHFKKYHHSGMITLTHNVSSSNAEALGTIISEMKTIGYRFGTLDELK